MSGILPPWFSRASASEKVQKAFADLIKAVTDAADEKGDDTADSGGGGAGPKAPGVARDADVEQLRQSVQTMRDDLKRFGAALAAGASAVIVGLGWATIHNIFPAPAQHTKLIEWAAYGLGVLTAGAAASLAALFFAAQRRIVFAPSEVDAAVGLNKDEKAVVTDVLTEHAQEELAVDAAALENRAMRLDRIARATAGSDADLAKRSGDEAARLYGVLALADLRAVASVVELRSQELFKWYGRPARRGAVAVLAGVALFLLADYSKGQRDLVDLRDKCQKAVTAGATTACDTVDGAPAPSSSAPGKAGKPADVSVLQRLAVCAAYTPTAEPASSPPSKSSPPPSESTPQPSPTPAEPPPPVQGRLQEVGIAACAGVALPSSEPSGTGTP